MTAYTSICNRKYRKNKTVSDGAHQALTITTTTTIDKAAASAIANTQQRMKRRDTKKTATYEKFDELKLNALHFHVVHIHKEQT